MANNPYVNKVIYGNDTVMDISDTTATESDVVSGKTFYKASGEKSTGSAVIPDISNCYQTTDTAETDIQDADYFPFYDSSASGKRKSLWSNIKAKLKAYFDTIYAVFSATETELRDTVGWTGKNLLENNLSSQTLNGITFTKNSDGSITCNGTASARAEVTIMKTPLFEGECILSGCPAGGTNQTYKLQYSNNVDASYGDFGDGIKCTQFNATTYPNAKVSIMIASGYTANNLVFKPMLRKASIADPTFEPYHKSVDECKLNVSDNIVYGAKNLFDKNRCTYSPNTTLTITETGIRIQGTQGSPAYIYNRTNLSDLPKGKRLKIVADAIVTTGSPYVELLCVFSDYSFTSIDSKAITSGKFEFEFTCPSSALALDIEFVEQSGNVDVILEHLMLVSATDNDTTYTNYVMSNEGLTDRIQEIVRTGVTASAGGSVRIPASGTDSRIRLNRSIVTPICDQKIVNGVGYPYKFKSCTVSEGYVTIVMAEAISNVDIGIQIVKY